MNRPKFLIHIDDEPSATRRQILGLLNKVKNFTQHCTWYAADIDAMLFSTVDFDKEITPDNPLRPWVGDPDDHCFLKRVGNFEELVDKIQSVSQFINGVLFALPNHIGYMKNLEFGAEDDKFRDLEEAILEIRMFDTTFVDVYSSNLELMTELANYYSVPIITDKENEE